MIDWVTALLNTGITLSLGGLIVFVIMVVFRKYVAPFDRFLSSLSRPRYHYQESDKSILIREIHDAAALLSLEEKLSLVHKLIGQDCIITIAVDDHSYWFQSIGGLRPGGE